MSPPATLTPIPPPTCWRSCSGRYANLASRSSWSRTTRGAPRTRTGSSSWPTGRWWANCSSRPPIPSWSRCGLWEPDMRNVTIKGLLAHKLRLALTALAIVLGVTFISGTFVLTDTLHNTFSVLFGNIYQKVDFQVRGVAQLGSGANATRNELPESLLATVRRVPGVEAAEGGVTGYAQFVAHDGQPGGTR